MNKNTTDITLSAYFNDIVIGYYEDEDLVKQFGRQLGFDVDMDTFMAVSFQYPSDMNVKPEDREKLTDAANAIIALSDINKKIGGKQIITCDSGVCVILIMNDKSAMRDLIPQIKETALEQVEKINSDRKIRVGIGTIESGIKGIKHTYINAQDAVKAGEIFKKDRVILEYMGMEMGGIHVKDIENPAKNYPKAVFIGAAITVIIFVLGTFALGIIIPEKDINLTQSLLVGFDNYFKYVHASWLSPIIAVALAFGVLAGVLTWVAGPSKGIFAVGKAGYLPPFFQKTNANGVQKNILLVQGLAVTLLSLLFVVMPSVQSFYQILSQLTVLLYLIMYLLMFSGAIYLRYNMKKAPRPFRIGSKGNGLMWLIGGLGFCGSLLAFVLSFIPPSQIAVGSNTVWFAVLIIGCIVVVAAPFIIYASRKPSWVDKNTQFEPFHWEIQATTAQTAAPVSGSAKSSASSASTNAAAGPASQSTPPPEQHK